MTIDSASRGSARSGFELVGREVVGSRRSRTHRARCSAIPSPSREAALLSGAAAARRCPPSLLPLRAPRGLPALRTLWRGDGAGAPAATSARAPSRVIAPRERSAAEGGLCLRPAKRASILACTAACACWANARRRRKELRWAGRRVACKGGGQEGGVPGGPLPSHAAQPPARPGACLPAAHLARSRSRCSHAASAPASFSPRAARSGARLALASTCAPPRCAARTLLARAACGGGWEEEEASSCA